jgi:hypothetical protein
MTPEEEIDDIGDIQRCKDLLKTAYGQYQTQAREIESLQAQLTGYRKAFRAPAGLNDILTVVGTLRRYGCGKEEISKYLDLAKQALD